MTFPEAVDAAIAKVLSENKILTEQSPRGDVARGILDRLVKKARTFKVPVTNSDIRSEIMKVYPEGAKDEELVGAIEDALEASGVQVIQPSGQLKEKKVDAETKIAELEAKLGRKLSEREKALIYDQAERDDTYSTGPGTGN